MKLLYKDYIKPSIESQPKEEDVVVQLDWLDNELDLYMQRVLENVLAYYTVQGFRLGLRTGVTIQPDL